MSNASSVSFVKPFTMRCGVCQVTHLYKNPKQFSSWARRHRAKEHPHAFGRIHFFRVVPKVREKKWTPYGMQPPCNPRAMLKLPALSMISIYHDRRTGIYWKDGANGWFYYNPQKHP